MSWVEARDKLRKFRETQTRNSEEVVELWEDILYDFSYKLGDELWYIYEQVCIAACDCGKTEIAELCVDRLKTQFPGSTRVRKLKGFIAESKERYDTAEEIYNSILEQDETNSIIRKRLIAIKKAQNQIPEAIKELNSYLKQYMTDHEAWMELCELYIQEQEYARASFCMEELIMSNPHNHLFHQKYAEIQYTLGNMENARSYFSQTIKLNPNNMRALFGLFMSASNLASLPRTNAKAKKDNVKYAAWAAEQINQKYKGKGGKDPASQVKALEGMLDNLQITHST